MAKRKPPSPPPSQMARLLAKIEGWKALLTFLVGLVGFMGLVWAGLVKIGYDPVFSGDLTALRVQVTKKIDDVETQVKKDLKDQISPVVDSIKGLGRTVTRAQIETHETNLARMRWTERIEREGSLQNIERQLRDHEANSRQETESYKILVQRRIELQTQIKNIDARISDTELRIKALKEQQL